jgi:hypothetical protein
MQYKLQLLKNLLLIINKNLLKLSPLLKDLVILDIAYITITRIN